MQNDRTPLALAADIIQNSYGGNEAEAEDTVITRLNILQQKTCQVNQPEIEVVLNGIDNAPNVFAILTNGISG